MKKILIALLFMSPIANANDLWVDANVASYHTNDNGYCYQGKCDEFNEFNYGLGLSYETSDYTEVQGGFFRNSYDKNSLYADVKVKYDFGVGAGVLVTPGLAIGLVTGYDDTELEASTFQPMVLPSVSVSYKRVRAVVGYIPASWVSDGPTDVITLQLGYRF